MSTFDAMTPDETLPFEPLAFDHARVTVARLLARRIDGAAAPELEDATRKLLTFGVGHPTLSDACAALGWTSELRTALVGELTFAATAPCAAELAPLGARIAAACAADEGAAAALVQRTSERVGWPASVGLHAVARAGLAGSDATVSRMERALVDWCAGRPATADGLVAELARAMAKGLPSCERALDALSPTARRSDATRGERVTRLVARLRTLSLEEPALEGWVGSAATLLPLCDVAAADVAHSLRLLGRGEDVRRGALALLAAVLPGAESCDDTLVWIDGARAVALVHEQAELRSLEGDTAAVRAALPSSPRHVSAGEPATLTSRVGGGATWTRRGLCGHVDVTVSFARCMGDTTVEVDVVRPDTGVRLAFLDDCPASIALRRDGGGVFVQRVGWDGTRRHEAHDLRSGERAEVGAPPARADVVLVTEAIGPDCPTLHGSFVFCDDG